MHNKTEKTPCRSRGGEKLRHGWPAAGREARDGERGASFGGLNERPEYVSPQFVAGNPSNCLNLQNPNRWNFLPLRDRLRCDVKNTGYRACTTSEVARLFPSNEVL